MRGFERKDEVKPLAAGRVGVDLYWNRLPLAGNGKPVAALVGNASATAQINALCQKESGIDLPIQTDPQAAVKNLPLIILFGTPDDPEVKAMLASGESAPLEKSRKFWIKEWTPAGSQGRVLWVGGWTKDDLALAVTRFGAFLRAEGRWLASN